MYIDLSKKEMATLLVLMDGANKRSKYWEGFEDTTPLVMQQQGIKHPKEGETICDKLQQKLNIWIEQ
jgi:hypothetical protein